MKRKIITVTICLLLVCMLNTAKAQFYSVKTNLIGLATANINAELSMALNRKWSLHVPVQYNPLVMRDNRQFRNLTVEPGVRYWFKESYTRNFIGLYAVASRFHFGKVWDNNRYDGNGFGAGVSYGHSYPVATRWNMEWEVGVGAVWADYTKYKCKKCGLNLGRKQGLYFVPTRIAVNIVYLF